MNLLRCAYAAILVSGCQDQTHKADDPFENRASMIMTAMGKSEVLTFSSADWVGSSNENAFSGNGDQAFEEAVIQCTWFGVWQPDSHGSTFSLPSERSSIWQINPNDNVISDRSIIACVAKKSKVDFYADVAENINQACCGTPVIPSSLESNAR